MASARMVTVKAGANGPVILHPPIDGRRSIGAEPVEVESTLFIRRRIAAGDLVMAPPAPPTRASKKED